MSNELPKNSVATIAAKINAFANSFTLAPEAVEVTSYEQMGPNVRVFYKRNMTFGKTPEQADKIIHKVRLCNELIPDPFTEDDGDVEPPIPDNKPVTGFTVDLPLSIEVDEVLNVVPVFVPTDATDKTFTVTANPVGNVDILNGGAVIRGKVAGQTVLTITPNGGSVAPVQHILVVEPAGLP